MFHYYDLGRAEREFVALGFTYVVSNIFTEFVCNERIRSTQQQTWFASITQAVIMSHFWLKYNTPMEAVALSLVSVPYFIKVKYDLSNYGIINIVTLAFHYSIFVGRRLYYIL